MVALDLKYRPRKFSDVVGNSGVVKLLLCRSRAGTLAGRSMMFGGPKGCGKTTLARIVATAVVCDHLEDGEPCVMCNSCESIISNTSSSVDEFDAATQGTVDCIRSIINDLEYGSADGKPRVVIFDEAQRLSKAAQDALLKVIEDRRLIVILCTTEPHKIGDAIRSRLEEYPISSPSEADVVSRLELVCKTDSIKFESDALSIIAKYNKCCLRTCLTSIDTLNTLGGVTVSSSKDLFRYESMDSLVSILSRIDTDISSFEDLDHLFDKEGASWVRDNIIAAISSTMRVAVGAKPTYAVPTEFFSNRGMRWSDLARVLGSLNRPTPHDIEVAIMSTGNMILSPLISPSLPIHTSAPTPAPTPAPKSIPHTDTQISQPISKPVAQVASIPKIVPIKSESISKKTLEIDGVTFTNDEKLTSLDHKIEPGGRVHNPPPIIAEVNLDKSKIPLSEREFARAFKSLF